MVFFVAFFTTFTGVFFDGFFTAALSFVALEVALTSELVTLSFQAPFSSFHYLVCKYLQ